MKHRNFRIAWSVAWGVVAILLCVLWVRSYWTYDAVQRKGRVTLTVQSAAGQLLFFHDYDEFSIPDGPNGSFHFRSERQKETSTTYTYIRDTFGAELEPHKGILGTWFVYDGPTEWHTGIPHWFALSVLLFAAAVPWLRWSNRFSLRTLLIATTVIAVVLGIIVWMSRAG